MNINAPTLAEAIAYLRDGGDAYERNRREEWHRRNAEAIGHGRRVDVLGVCGESEDCRWARLCGSTMEARERRGENNG